MLPAVVAEVLVPELQLTGQQELTLHLPHQILLAHWEKMEPITQAMVAVEEPGVVDSMAVRAETVVRETTAEPVVILD